MIKTLTRFLVRLALWLWALHLIAFVLFDLLPSPEFRIAGWAGIDPTVLATTRQKLGLHGSFIARYFTSLFGVVRGNFGNSIVGDYPVSQLFATRVLISMPQWIASVVLLLVVPIPVGTLFCACPLGLRKNAALFSAHALLIPQFLACCAGQAFYVLGPSQWIPVEFDEFAKRFLAVLCSSVAPLAIAFIAAANTAASCAEQPFVTAHLALGASWWRVRRRIMKNVALATKPLIARLALYVILGSVFAEPLFSIKGVGALFWDALRASDVPTMMAFVLFVGAITLVFTAVETAHQ